MSKPYYITTAIFYASGIPHIGNVYEGILSDAIARFKKLEGYDVNFQTGTDEHGQKIQLKAEEAGVTPQVYVDGVATQIADIFKSINVDYDKFMKTTDPYHKEQVQKIYQRLFDQGDIYKGHYEGHYCIACESFFTDSQLVDGKCPDCGKDVVYQKEEAYFLKLSKYQERLVKHIHDNPSFIQPESRKNEMLNNFLSNEIPDLCVSRSSFDWGVELPFDSNHVSYVWIDALSNYITGIGFDLDGNHSEEFNKYWPADVHMIGKDILRFHTIYWPIMLMALDVELPKQIFGHPWILTGSEKMSKSTGNLIYTDDLIKYFGVDATRYYVLHEIPFAQDGTLTYDLFIERFNSDLANTLGNLVNRTISMINKYFGGEVRQPNEKTELDLDLIKHTEDLLPKVTEYMDVLKVGDAIEEVIKLLRRANKYIDETQPWVLGKDEEQFDRLATVLYNLIEVIRVSAVVFQAYIPDTADEIFTQINSDVKSFESIEKFGGYVAGVTLEKPRPLFNRMKASEKLEEIANDI
jgi:methionyl-tRNA synthetase